MGIDKVVNFPFPTSPDLDVMKVGICLYFGLFKFVNEFSLAVWRWFV